MALMCPTTHTLFFSGSPGRWSHILIPFCHLLRQQSQWRFMLSENFFCQTQHKSLIVIVDWKIILSSVIIILHFFPRHPMVFSMSTSTRQLLSQEGLTSLTTFLYRHKLTWQVDVQGCKKLYATVWQKLITEAKGKAKIGMSPFPDFINSLWSIFRQMWSLSKHANLNIYFLNLANLFKAIILFQGVV